MIVAGDLVTYHNLPMNINRYGIVVKVIDKKVYCYWSDNLEDACYGRESSPVNYKFNRDNYLTWVYMDKLSVKPKPIVKTYSREDFL